MSVQDGPTQQRVRALHARRYSTADMAAALDISADRVRKVCAALRLMPWPTKRGGKTAQPRESRQDIERRVAVRRAAIGAYWRQHPTATASDVAEALGFAVSDVRKDRITLGLCVRRGRDSIKALADEGLSASEISRRVGVGADRVRRILAAGSDHD
jgi:hypothetical protein